MQKRHHYFDVFLSFFRLLFVDVPILYYY